MAHERFHKNYNILNQVNVGNSFLLVDSPEFKKPSIITLEKIAGILQIKVNEDLLKERNVTAVEIGLQEAKPSLPPGTFSVVPQTHIAVDDNYLYVWVQKQNRWKRIVLSDW